LRFAFGMPALEAALDIASELPETWGDRWLDGERLAVNVETVYREFGHCEILVPGGEVPADLEGQARTGRDNCPERAIGLVE